MRLIDADVINALKSQGYKAKSGSTLRYWKKSELIEQINTLEHNWGCEIIAHNRGVKYAEDLLKKQGWHYPSKGEYPPIGEHRVASDLVLTFCDENGFMVYYLDRYNVYNEWEKYPHNPTAWMPLPKPPKEEI